MMQKNIFLPIFFAAFHRNYGHVKQIGNKFTKYTKNGAFGFFNWHYFFVDHELITPCFVFFFQQAGAFLRGCIFFFCAWDTI